MLRTKVLKTITAINLSKGAPQKLNTYISFAKMSSLQEIEKSSKILMEKVLTKSTAEAEDDKFKDFCKRLWRVHEATKKKQKITNQRDLEYRMAPMTSRQPLKDTLRIYEAYTPKWFEDDHLAASVAAVARILRIFNEKPHYYLDLTRQEMFDDWRFKDMVEDIKYASHKGVEINFDNYAKIIESLASIQYRDVALNKAIIQKLHRLLNKKDEGLEYDPDNPLNQPQSGKAGYYKAETYTFNDFAKIPNAAHYIKKIMSYSNPTQTINTDADPEGFERLLNTLSNFDIAQTPHHELASAILAIRDQYYKLTQSQKEDFILQNKILNNEMLEVEEKLIEAGLITPLDVINPDYVSDPKLKLEQAAKILRNVLIETRSAIPTNATTLIDLETRDPRKRPPLSNITLEAFRNDFTVLNFSRCSAELVSYANVSHFDLGKDTSAHEKWEKLLPNPTHSKYIRNKIEEYDFREYFLAPHFSMIWQDTKNFLKESFPLIGKDPLLEKSLEANANLAYSYSRVGLSKPTKFFLNRAVPLISDIDLLPVKVFINLLRALTYVTAVQKSSLYQPIFKYISENSMIFTLDEALETLHFMSVHNLHSNGNFNNLLKIVNTFYVDNAITEITDRQRELLHDIDLYLSNVPQTKDFLSLSPHLEFVIKTADVALMKKHEKKNVIDPLKKIVEQAAARTLGNKSSNLLPSEIENLSEFHKPAVYVPGENSKYAIFVDNGSGISTDENEVSELLQFRFNQIQKICPKIVCKATNYHNILNIDYIKAELSFKSEDFMKELLKEVYNPEPNLLELNRTCNELINVYENLISETENGKQRTASQMRESMIKAPFYERIIRELYQFFALKKEQDSIFEPHQKALYADRIKFQLANIASIISTTPDLIIKEWNAIGQKLYKKDLMAQLKSVQKCAFLQVGNKTKVQNQDWFGVNYGEEVLFDQSLNTGKKNIDIEIYNQNFGFDVGYYLYEDWRQHLEAALTPLNLNIKNEESQITASKTGERILKGLIPDPARIRNYFRPNSFSWNWEIFAYDYPPEIRKELIENELLTTQTQNDLSKETAWMISLSNLVYEIKAKKSPQKIVEELLSLDFVEELAQDHLEGKQNDKPKSGFRVPRNPEDYFKYLTKISTSPIMRDKYSAFFVDEGDYALRAKEMKKKYEARVQALYQEYLDGKIKSQEYEDGKGSLRNDLIEQLVKLGDGVFDREEIIQDFGRVFDFKLDAETLVKPKDLAGIYNHKTDEDFIRCGEDARMTLEFKRVKAETKFIKLRIIRKLHNETPLSETEKKYLAAWNNALKEVNLKQTDTTLVPKNATGREISSFSSKDAEYFAQFRFFNSKTNSDCALSDIILELSNFVDESIIERVEKTIKGKEIAAEWDISSNFKFDQADNKEIKVLSTEIEEYIWQKAGEFSKEEIEALHEMFGIMRGYSQADKQWFPIDKESLNEFLRSINSYENRAKYLLEWFERKENEYENRIKETPQPQFLRTDNYFRGLYEESLNKTLKKVIELVFNTSYEKVTGDDIHRFVENVIDRTYLLKKYLPKKLGFIIRAIFIHPATDPLDKHNMMAALELQNIKLETTHSPLVALHDFMIEGVKVPEDSNFTAENIKERTRNARIPFVEKVANKFVSSV